MSRSKQLFLCLTAVAALVQGGESVLVLPGAGGAGTQIPVFSANPFNVQTTITGAAPGAFQVLTTPDGQKNYLISNTGGTGVAVYDQNFSSGRTISGSISLAPTAAALSPDGRRLLVLAGNVYIFDTATDTIINGAGTVINGTLIDIAFSIDSAKAYVLSNNGNAGVITPFDLVNNSTGTPLVLAGAGSGIAMAPNGLLYVATPNRLFEINPRTLTVTPSGEIPVNANPGKPVFTPDGKYALAINRTPITGSSVLEFDLGNHTLAGAFPNFAVTLDRLVVAGPNRIFAYSSQNNSLYEVVVQTGLNINPSSLQSILPSSVGSFAVSNESPARSIYITAVNQGQNNLYKVDLPNNNIIGQFLVSNTAGQVVAYASPNPTSGAATISTYNASQIVQPGAISLPLVARVLDSLGRPVVGARVDYTTTTVGTVLTPASAFTNSDGYAQTYVTAPSTPGPVTVTAATAGSQPGTYTVTVPGSGGGGGGGTNLAGIKIISGNGQIVPEQFLATQPLTVQVVDANGNPAGGVPVTFTITQGQGTILGGTSTTVNTDPTTGQASTTFLATAVPTGNYFTQATINAASTAGSVNFTITTAVNQLPNGAPAPLPSVYLILPDFSSNPTRLLKGGAGEILKGAIQVQVVAGNGMPLPNVALNVGPNPGEDPTKVPSASCATPALTDANGIATCDVLMGNVLGTNSATVNVGGLVNTASVLVQVTVGAPAKVTKANGDSQSGKPGERLGQPLRVRVTDSAGNSLNNIPLSWTVTQGQATLSATNTSTDVNGTGQTTVTLGSIAGTVNIKVTAGAGANAPSATFTLTVNVTIGGITIVSGNSQVTGTGQAFPSLLTVQVIDDKGAPMNGIPVSWAVASGQASLSQTSSTTDASGRASVSATAGATAGQIVVTASVGSFNTSFNLTARLPGPNVGPSSFVNAASGVGGLTPCGIAIAQSPGLVPNVQGTVVAKNFVGPMPTTLSGVDLTVNGIAAPIYWLTSSMVAFQTPCETQPGSATVIMRVSGGSTTVQGVPVTAVQPGLFEWTTNGQKFAVLLHEDGSYVTPSSPARRGERIKLFATGLGSVTTPTGTGITGIGGQTVDAPVTVGVNNGGVRVISAEYMAGEVGLFIVTFEVPADTQPGPQQNLALAVTGADGNTVFGNGSFIPIQ